MDLEKELRLKVLSLALEEAEEDPEDIEDPERREFEIALRRAKAQPKNPDDTMSCKECGEEISSAVSRLTEGKCPDCYREIEFGIIPKISTTVGAGTPFFNRGEENAEDPAYHNAVRAREE